MSATHTVSRRSRPVIALDSNAWAYVVEAGAVDKLRCASKSVGVDVGALPAVLYEALRMPDGAPRRAIVEVLTRQVWNRPMPEAFSEAMELRDAFSRRRPSWLLDAPDLRQWNRERADWSTDMVSGTWARARRRTADMSRWIGDGRLPDARREASDARRDVMKQGLTFGRLDVDLFESWFDHAVDGWDGRRFASWRGEAINVWMPVVSGFDRGPYAEWLMPFVRRDILRSDWKSWVRFWTREITAAELPRQWLRSTMRMVASTRKTSPGTPVDVQISTYLVDLDAFFTADSVLVDCIEKVRETAPVPLASAHLIRGGASGVGDLIEGVLALADRPER